MSANPLHCATLMVSSQNRRPVSLYERDQPSYPSMFGILCKGWKVGLGTID
jgi:hypothetical protein